MSEDSTLVMLDKANEAVSRAEKRLAEAHKLKMLLSYLPREVLALNGAASLVYKDEVLLKFDNYYGEGDLTYATLFDAGFEFEAKPKFWSWSQTFAKVGSLTIDAPAIGTVKYQAIVSVSKPPSCTIVSETEMQEVTTFKAICAEDGEVL